jgi:hypothetical protein
MVPPMIASNARALRIDQTMGHLRTFGCCRHRDSGARTSVSGNNGTPVPAAIHSERLSLSSQPSGAGSLRFAPASPALAPR